MGYSYDGQGRLCCDICDRSGGVRKHRCPFGWCQSLALCPACRSGEGKKYRTVAYHKGQGCEARHNEFAKEKAEAQELLSQGKFLRKAAMGHGQGRRYRVKVHFENFLGQVKAFWMSPNTYRAIPILTNATIEDYQKIGKLSLAKSTNLREDL